MKTFTLSTLFLIICLNGYSTTWTVVNSGFSFSPSTLTITEGDTVVFDLASEHNSTEVSEATWNANGNTPLPGGWLTNFGGGMVLPSDLTPGTHFYVCQPHASGGMKGRIIVQQSTGIEESSTFANVAIYPNPSHGRIHLSIDKNKLTDNTGMEVFDMQGVRVYSILNLEAKVEDEIDLSHLHQGIYFIRLSDSKGILTRKIVVQ